MNAAFIAVIASVFFGYHLLYKIIERKKIGALGKSDRDEMLMLAAAQSSPAKLLDLVNQSVTMSRARAVRVQDDSLTVIYARENRTKGRVKFRMDGAFDDVSEGDVGVLVIVDQELHGKDPFYKFIRDADIPTIADVIDVGTGDDLTDRIYAAAFESRDRNTPRNGSDKKGHPGIEMPRA